MDILILKLILNIDINYLQLVFLMDENFKVALGMCKDKDKQIKWTQCLYFCHLLLIKVMVII